MNSGNSYSATALGESDKWISDRLFVLFSSRSSNWFFFLPDPASGGAEDWAKGRMGVKYSYLFELRPDGDVWDGFLLDENQVNE